MELNLWRLTVKINVQSSIDTFFILHFPLSQFRASLFTHFPLLDFSKIHTLGIWALPLMIYFKKKVKLEKETSSIQKYTIWFSVYIVIYLYMLQPKKLKYVPSDSDSHLVLCPWSSFILLNGDCWLCFTETPMFQKCYPLCFALARSRWLIS